MNKHGTNISGGGPAWTIDQPDGKKQVGLSQLWNILEGTDKSFVVEWYSCDESSPSGCDCPPDERGKEYVSDGNGNCIRFAEPLGELKEAASGFAEVVVESDCLSEDGGAHPVAWVTSGDDVRTIHLCGDKLPKIGDIATLMNLVRSIGPTIVHEWAHEKNVNRPLLTSLEGQERVDEYNKMVGTEGQAESAEGAFRSSISQGTSFVSVLKKLGDSLDDINCSDFANSVDNILIKLSTGSGISEIVSIPDFDRDAKKKSCPECNSSRLSELWFKNDTGFEPGDIAGNIARFQSWINKSGYSSSDGTYDRDWRESSSSAFKEYIGEAYSAMTTRGRCNKTIIKAECAKEFLKETILSGLIGDGGPDIDRANRGFALITALLLCKKTGTEGGPIVDIFNYVNDELGYDCSGLTIDSGDFPDILGDSIDHGKASV